MPESLAIASAMGVVQFRRGCRCVSRAVRQDEVSPPSVRLEFECELEFKFEFKEKEMKMNVE